MTDQWPADEIAEAFQEAAPEFAGNFHPDTFQVERVPVGPDGLPGIPDGSGGRIVDPVIVASGRCRLDVTTRGAERASGALIVAVTSYEVELPLDVDLKATDTLYVNGRKFAVIDIRRGGEFEMFTVAGVEERK